MLFRVYRYSIFIIFFQLLLYTGAEASFFDFKPFQNILNRYLHEGVVIKGIKLNALDYDALYKESKDKDSDYQRLLKGLKSFNPENLKSHEERVAFWINVYNIGAIKMIIDHYPVDSIRSMKINFFKNPWGMEIINIGGRMYSLKEIEHGILLGKLKEKRAHFAIVCASLTCPDLAKEIYTPEKLKEQLTRQARLFINNPHKGYRIDRKNNVLYVSKIFNWDKKSFPKGKEDIIPFILPYIDKPEDREFIKKGRYRLDFLDYDWDLNIYRKR